MDAVEVVGPYRGPSGYDRHTREFVRQFVRMGVRVQLHHLDGWSAPLPEHLREASFEQLTEPVGAGVLLHFTMPNHARPRRGMRNVNYTMFEAGRIPPAWAARAAEHDRIVVPTASSRDAWIGSGVDPERVRVSGLGVDTEFFAAEGPPLPLAAPDGRPLASFRHRFLNIADLRPRKNHLGLLRCWIRATRADDDAVLVVKTAAHAPRELELFRADVLEMQNRLGRTLDGAAPVIFLPATMTHEQLRALYKAATHYLSLSKGEGWDQVMMEAAVAGLQLIAPRHSAYTEYLGDEDAELIEARPVPAVFEGKLHAEDRALFEGVQWWQPDEEAATDLIRRIIGGKTSPKQSPGSRIGRDYSWEAAARSLLRILDETLDETL
jgi:glycosyltransferase involved in cell wall biosynthesis